MWRKYLINYEVISPHFRLHFYKSNFGILVKIMNCRKHTAFCVFLFYPVKLIYTYCGSVRPVIARELCSPELGKMHIIDTKLSSWPQMFCVFGGELCNCTVTDQSYLYFGLYLVFLWDSIMPVRYLSWLHQPLCKVTDKYCYLSHHLCWTGLMSWIIF